jgi:regulator of sigma E protease
MFNIEVEEFGLGFPPRAKRLFTWKGTDFTLNWIPFGAFVRPKGENDPEVAGGMAAAAPLKRLVVLLAGPFMNLVAGLILFSLIFLQTGVPDQKTVLIGGIVKESAAEAAGIQAGDVVTQVNGQLIDSTAALRAIIQANPGKEIALNVNRSGQSVTLKATPKSNPPGGEGILGVMLTNPVINVPWFQTLPIAFDVSVEYARQLFTAPFKLILGQISPSEGRVTSIFGLGNMFVQARERDKEAQATPNSSTPAVTSLTLMAIISVALGITNLLPIPALDGGRILFLLPELLVRRRIPAKYENMVHVVGFMALLLLMVVVSVQDFISPPNLP